MIVPALDEIEVRDRRGLAVDADFEVGGGEVFDLLSRPTTLALRGHHSIDSVSCAAAGTARRRMSSSRGMRRL
ncbi:MAG: hypothetical protein DMF56_06165 [Acidobacteria bacterium]|nr:MAG: hypothetical protein DMF56_06165 [Acidobacteriota bacterium]